VKGEVGVILERDYTILRLQTSDARWGFLDGRVKVQEVFGFSQSYTE
jgi:hypothetical protein